MQRKSYQRTLEEALAGVPARRYVVNRSEEPIIDPETGRQKYAPGFLKGKRKFKEGGGWFRWATDPTHPKYTKELAEKHFRMIQANGKKGAETRRSTPKGYRARDWKPIWQERLKEAERIVDELITKDLVELPEDELKKAAGREALIFNTALIRSQEFNIADRLKASRNLLDYCVTKPVEKKEVEVKTAEDLLAAVADDLGL